MGLYTPTILGENSYLSWLYDRGAIKDQTHTGTSKGLSQAINRGPIRKFLPEYANVYVIIQSHGLSAGARSHYITANGVRNGLTSGLLLHLGLLLLLYTRGHNCTTPGHLLPRTPGGSTVKDPRGSNCSYTT